MSEPPTIASENVELTSATKMPILGLGTWQLRGRSAVNAVLRALEVGYRHIDTATAYGNEEQVGQAVAQSMRACSSHTGSVVCRSRVIARSRPSTCATRGSFELPRVTA